MKSREHVTTNGRAAFYACMWDDLRNTAMDCGWALGLHGSLKNDMDIMAMPWTEDAKPIGEMLQAMMNLFTDNTLVFSRQSLPTEKPNNRIVYSVSIWADFYMDISVMNEVLNSEQNVQENK